MDHLGGRFPSVYIKQMGQKNIQVLKIFNKNTYLERADFHDIKF